MKSEYKTVEYILNIKREIHGSVSLMLKDIKVSNYKLGFEKTVNDYELYINNEKSLDIEVIPENKDATIEIQDNENLINNSIITIKVSNKTDENIYTIKIKKETKKIKNETKKKIDIGEIILTSITILAGIGLIMYYKKTNKKIT